MTSNNESRGGIIDSLLLDKRRPRNLAGPLGFQRFSPYLSRDNVGCAWALLALSNLELDLLAFIERCVAGGLDFRMMDEQIIATVIRNNKTETLGCVKPFYCTCTHCNSPWLCERATNISLCICLLGTTIERWNNVPTFNF